MFQFAGKKGESFKEKQLTISGKLRLNPICLLQKH